MIIVYSIMFISISFLFVYILRKIKQRRKKQKFIHELFQRSESKTRLNEQILQIEVHKLIKVFDTIKQATFNKLELVHGNKTQVKKVYDTANNPRKFWKRFKRNNKFYYIKVYLKIRSKDNCFNKTANQ